MNMFSYYITTHFISNNKYYNSCHDSHSVYQTYSNILIKNVNTVPEAVPVWPPVQYISDTGQYRYTVSGLPLYYIYIYIYMYVCVYIYYNKYKSLP